MSSPKLSLSIIPARCKTASLFVTRFLPFNRFMAENMRLLELIQKFSPQHKLLGFLTLLYVIGSRNHRQSNIREVTVGCGREKTARHVTTGYASNHFSNSCSTHVQLGLAVACLYARSTSELLNNNMKKHLIDLCRILLFQDLLLARRMVDNYFTQCILTALVSCPKILQF